MKITIPRPVLFVLLAAVCLAAFAALGTRTSPAPSAAIANIENLSPVRLTDGFCLNATTTPTDAWLSAPARITALNGDVRFLVVCHQDSTNTTVGTCASLNNSTGMTCNKDTGTRGLLSSFGSCININVARDSAGAAPQVFLESASGTVTTCIDVGL